MVPLLFLLFSFTAQVLTSQDVNREETIFYKIEEVDKIFANYVIEFNKNYNDEEYKNRLAIFSYNLEEINKMNEESNMTSFGINKFTDMTFEEVSSRYMGVRKDFSRKGAIVHLYEATGQAPDELDYRTYGFVSEVKDQGPCNSCYVFSAIGNIEGQYAKKYNQLISLSEQQGLDCELKGNCSAGGIVDEVMLALAKEGGCMKEEDYPYEIQDEDAVKKQCRTDKSKIVAKVIDAKVLDVKDEEALKDALFEYGPLSIGIYTCESLVKYEHGVFHYKDCNKNLHGVVLIGYGTADDSMPYWLIKNSWGTIWGENGFLRMQRGVSLLGIGFYVATSVVA